MRILSAMLLLLGTLAGCQQPVREAPAELPAVEAADTLPLPAPLALNASARNTLENWGAFRTLEDRIESVYAIRGPEDMELKLEELAEDFQALEDSEYPQAFDLPAVRSRERVVRTFLFKTQAAIYYRRDYRPALRQFLEAYNALREQLNRVESNQLDPSLFRDNPVNQNEQNEQDE
ncbi:hypothetical protein [Robiginitalea sp. SC105]|uniref:hypothetical protein n=1 Tax=Robiginitalea sp. SC105 TaxID=2762332 RepID=UPI0016395B06|nr:hypothetical protein [Robiginitalea sp. SC105]MBC2838492.1 hypothetical protein [Robiginitalea sp. SC105]